MGVCVYVGMYVPVLLRLLVIGWAGFVDSLEPDLQISYDYLTIILRLCQSYDELTTDF